MPIPVVTLAKLANQLNPNWAKEEIFKAWLVNLLTLTSELNIFTVPVSARYLPYI
jgi:hypothetical protein